MPEGAAEAGAGSPRKRARTQQPVPVRVELLDDSHLDLQVDRKIRGHELMSRVCEQLNLLEKDYFGLLFPGEGRVWLDPEKRVSKFFARNEQWQFAFAVKFYPPEPAQLQEELTRYQLVLAIRKELLSGRLPCSSVTHALLASYLLQSELGDFEDADKSAAHCRRLRLAPAAACTPELEQKVAELHKSHRGQTPAEAELNYLENAKKLAMYGVELHPAKDSQGVEITLGVCSSGLLVHREKLRINRFAWPKILKISYKRHNFYVKLRPGEFDKYESTVGFKLANHRAAKKLWKTCVQHHTFFRLTTPEPAKGSTLFPRLGSRFRYSGRTHYESRANTVQRAPPAFNRALSARGPASRSMDALTPPAKEELVPPEPAKRTVAPLPAPRPNAAKDKKPPPGAVRVMPSGPVKEKKEAEAVQQRKPNENGTETNGEHAEQVNNAEMTPKKSKTGGLGGLFGAIKNRSPKDTEEKSPKQKLPKEKSPKKVKDPKASDSQNSSRLESPVKSDGERSPDKPGHTKPYEFIETDPERSPRKPYIQGAFSYEKDPQVEERQKSPDDSQSPTTRRATGLAFNYAPGEDKKVVESAEKRKTSPVDSDIKLITPGIDYVQSAALKEQAKAAQFDSAALLHAERAHHMDSTNSVAAPILAVTPAKKEVQVVVITAKYNPKTKKLDEANGIVHVGKGVVDPSTGKIQTDSELIDPKSGQVQYKNPSTGKEEIKNGHVDSKTGNILFSNGVVDPKTGKIDSTLAQQYTVVEQSPDKIGAKPGKEVDLVVITSKYDGKHKKLDASHGHVDVSKAVLGPDCKLQSNYGVIDTKGGKIDYVDPKTGKQEQKQAYVDPKTGNLLVTTGITDPRTGKLDTSLGQLFSIVERDAGKANREVRLVVLTGRYDLKNKKLDLSHAHIDAVKATLSGSDGKIYTEYGVINPRNGEILYTDPMTGKQEAKQGKVDPKTGNILLLSGVIDPRTGKLDTNLGQQYSIVDKPIDTFGSVSGKEVQLVVITSKFDNKSKKLDNPNGFIETSKGVISSSDHKVHTNFGVLDPKTGKVHVTDPKTGKPDVKQAFYDHKSNSFILTSGVVDPLTGKSDSSLAQQLTIVDPDAPKQSPERYCDLVIITTKFDPKSKKLDPVNAHITSIPGKIGTDDKVRTSIGIIDPSTGEITITDPVTGKQELKKAQVDPKTGNLILTSGVVDPKTGKVDSSLGQQISIVEPEDEQVASIPGNNIQLITITTKFDPKNKHLENINGNIHTSKAVLSSGDGKVHSNIGIIDLKTGKIQFTDPKTGKQETKQATIDPKIGNIIIVGVVDPKTGKIDNSLAQQIVPVGGDLKPVEKEINLVIITTKYDPKTKKLDSTNPQVTTVSGLVGPDGKARTAFCVIDTHTGEITTTDPVTGKQEIKKAQVDTKTGNLILTSGVVDPKTGQVDPNLGQQLSIVDKETDTFNVLPGKEVKLVIITSKYDPKHKNLDSPNGQVQVVRGVIDSDGKVHSNFGVLDPKTGNIQITDPKTGKQEIKQATIDPKTGNIVLTSGVVDPKSGKIDTSLAQQLCVVDKEDKPIETVIHLVIITTKYDSKTKKLDASNLQVNTIAGTIGNDGKVRTDIGIIDPNTGEITVTDPKSGKQEVIKAQRDPASGHLLITSQVIDPKTGKVDPTLAQQYSIVNKQVVPVKVPDVIGEVQLVVITGRLDPKTKTIDPATGHIDASNAFVSSQDGKIHTDFGIIDPKSGQILYKDHITGKQELKQAQIDPKTGKYLITVGVTDPKTGKIDPTFAEQISVVDKHNVMSRVSSPVSARQSSSPVPPTSPLKTTISSPIPSPIQKTPTTVSPPTRSSALVSPRVPPPEPPKPKIVKIMVIFTRIDPKTKKPDLYTAEVEHLTGILEPNGLIETKYGVIDSYKGTIVITDPATGQKQTRDGSVLPETGQVFINTGVVDPKSGKLDPNLGMIMSVAHQDNPVVDITTITGPVEPKTKRVRFAEGTIEHTKGKVDSGTGHISTKYGVIDPTNGVIFVSDTSGVQDTKPIHVDENTGQITIVGSVDPKTGKSDPNLGQVLVVGSHIDPVVEVTTCVGKVDSKKGIIEPKHSMIETTTGQLNPENNKIDTKYGQIDLVKGTVTYNDPKTGKYECKEVRVDPITGQILLKSGQVNPKSGKPDKDFGRLISLRIMQNKVDPVSGKQIVMNEPKNIKVDPKTNQMWTAGPKDPANGETIYTTGQIDPKTGYIITIYGRIDPKTGNVIRTTSIDKSLVKLDPVSGQIYTATGDNDPNGQPLYSASQVDPASGEIITKLGVIDPKNGRLVIIKIYIITRKDDKGKVKELDPREYTIDETTGRVVTTKTVYVYQMVDPITGETIEVDPDDPRLKGARTTVTQTMTLSGKIDPVTGRIKTEYGDIDPDTGDIDPSTAVRDPVTGQLILHYSQIDPSHFTDKSCNYSIEKETHDLPANIDIQTVNTTKFSTFGKDESPTKGDEPKTFTEYTTSEHIKHQGIVTSTTPLSSKIPISQRTKVKTPTPPAAPVVVKTTTKQLLTKNDDGVTHNVEQEVENLGTGEVTFSTQTNKAESLEPVEGGKSPYVTARAVTTRTATTHEDLGTNAKTQQMEEKTVAHTMTSSATRQEQRVVTQQVKTTVTTGDQQLARRGSESSVSSGDSGTPIDFEEGAGEGHYDTTEPGSYTTTKTSTVMSNAPFGSIIDAAVAQKAERHGSESEPAAGDEGEIVSSQTISSKTRTVETITYKTERDGVVETRMEQKITIQSDGDPIDHDRALAEAIQEATAMNPDMTVEKIEIQQQSTQP